MRRVVWSAHSREDIRKAVTYISESDPQAARVVRNRLHDAATLLAEMPIGHQGRVKGTYEKYVRKTSYILAYTLSDRAITILRVIHASRDWPDDVWPEGE